MNSSKGQGDHFSSDCMICCEDLNSSKFKLDCSCKICEECFHSWVMAKNSETLFIENSFFNCPNGVCKALIDKSWVISNINQKYQEELNELLLKKYLNTNKNMIKCPKSQCGFVGFIDREGCRENLQCGICNETWNSSNNRNCPGYMDSNGYLSYFAETIKLGLSEEITELRVKMTTKPCFHCNRNTFKYQGCDHMTCSCQQEFCYLCLGDYKTHNDFKFCTYKYRVLQIVSILLIIIGVFKLLLSFYYIKACLNFIGYLMIVNVLAYFLGCILIGILYLCYKMMRSDLVSYSYFKYLRFGFTILILAYIYYIAEVYETNPKFAEGAQIILTEIMIVMSGIGLMICFSVGKLVFSSIYTGLKQD